MPQTALTSETRSCSFPRLVRRGSTSKGEKILTEDTDVGVDEGLLEEGCKLGVFVLQLICGEDLLNELVGRDVEDLELKAAEDVRLDLLMKLEQIVELFLSHLQLIAEIHEGFKLHDCVLDGVEVADEAVVHLEAEEEHVDRHGETDLAYAEAVLDTLHSHILVEEQHAALH